MRHLYLSGMLSCALFFSLAGNARQLPADTSALKKEYDHLYKQYINNPAGLYWLELLFIF